MIQILKILNQKLIIDNVALLKEQLHNYVSILNPGTKYGNRIHTDTLTSNSYWSFT